MSEKKALPNIAKRAPNARTRPLSLTPEYDPSEAKTIQDFVPTFDLSDLPTAEKTKPAASSGDDGGFEFDFEDEPAPTPKRR